MADTNLLYQYTFVALIRKYSMLPVVDLIIEAQTLLPMTEDTPVLAQQAIVIQDGIIKAIGKPQDIDKKYRAKEHLKRSSHVLLPGFINTHTHVPMNVFRGLADDYPLMTWLTEHIWPAEGKFMGEAFIREGTELAIAEMLRSGTTCFNDMYFFHDKIAETALEAGIRAQVGLCILEFPTPWAQNATEYVSKAAQTLKHAPTSDLLTFTIAPHAVYTVNDDTLLRCKALADEYGVSIHMHVQETRHEVEESLAKRKKRPLRHCLDLGLVDKRFMAVHMTQIDDEDIEILKTTQAHVVHCPQSNMKLASGVCPIYRLTQLGINVSIGTDSAASNNDLNLLEEMRVAALLAKVSTENAAAIPAEIALKMGTLYGAKAMGLADKIGSLEVGKQADIICVDMNSIELLPVFHPHSQLIYSANRENITDVWVKGRALLANRQLTTIDEERAKSIAKSWARKIRT